MFTQHFSKPEVAKEIIADWTDDTLHTIQHHYAVTATLEIMLKRVNNGEEFDELEFDARFIANTADMYFVEFNFEEKDVEEMITIITAAYYQELLVLQQTVELSRIPKEPNWAYLTKMI